MNAFETASSDNPSIPRGVVIESRAKIMWGEPAEKVISYLQTKGVSDKDAIALLADCVAERERDIRSDGVKLPWTGILAMLAPVACYLGSIVIGRLPLKFFSGTLVVGGYGVWRATKGFFMMTRPQSFKGSLANIEH